MHAFFVLLLWFFAAAVAAEIAGIDAAAAACPRSVGIRFSAVATEVSAVLCSAAACPDGLVSVLYRLLLEQRIIFLRLHVLEHGRCIHASGLLGKSHTDKTVHCPGFIGCRLFPWQMPVLPPDVRLPHADRPS